MWGDPLMVRRESDERPLPTHPYRDSAIVYGVMAVILVVLAGITGGSLVKATGAAIIFWLGATGWSWWKFRGRIRERERAASASAAVEGTGSEGGGRPSGAPTNGAVNGVGTGNGNGNGRGVGTGGTES